MRALIPAVLFGSCLSFLACSAPGGQRLTDDASPTNETMADGEIRVPTVQVSAFGYQSLHDLLVRLPGTVLTGAGWTTSITYNGSRNPLYVLDDCILGDSYYKARQYVDVKEVTSVAGLTREQAVAIYGPQARNGAIVILTRDRSVVLVSR